MCCYQPSESLSQFIPQYFKTWVCTLFMAKGHIRYCGLVHRPHVQNNDKLYT